MLRLPLCFSLSSSTFPSSNRAELTEIHAVWYVFCASTALYAPFALNAPSTTLVLLGELITNSFNIQRGIHSFRDVFTH